MLKTLKETRINGKTFARNNSIAIRSQKILIVENVGFIYPFDDLRPNNL